MADTKKTKDRRAFLGEAVATAAGLTAMASLASAETTTESGTSGTPSPDVIADIKVIKDDEFGIPLEPGGKERISEYEIIGRNGVMRRCRSHSMRFEREGGYTMTTDVTILTYPAGADREAKAPFSTSQRCIVHGTKGEVKGTTRMDNVIITTIFEDGSSSRSTHVAPVSTNLSAQFEGMSLSEIVRKTGEKRGITFASS
jgi:predicted pyridoxine 5'-phosphate oxidase superfamily flavin-nucleotide-binding protein